MISRRSRLSATGTAHQPPWGTDLQPTSVAGDVGFGVSPAPTTPQGFSSLDGTFIKSHRNYGNYMYVDGSVMCWVPAFCYRIGHIDNSWYAEHGLNSIDVKPLQSFPGEDVANAKGFVLHRAFKDGGAVKEGFMVDKYMCSKTASGSGFVASSIANALALSTGSLHNPIADLTACVTNNYSEAINAAHARDGVDGEVNLWSIFFCCSRFIYSALAMLSMAHGQASFSTEHCAWFQATYNAPKGCNNNALGDSNDGEVAYVSDEYSNCGKTGSGTPFAKTTHNGQESGIADLNGLMWEVSLGLTCIASTVAIQGLSRDTECVVTWVGHGLSTGATVQLGVTAITQADWDVLTAKLYSITVIDADSFSLDGVDTSLFVAEYDQAVDPGTIGKGYFYASTEGSKMAAYTNGNSLPTDHWGAVGVAATMSPISPSFKTEYPVNGYGQRFGYVANQVLSGDPSGDKYTLTGLGVPFQGDAISTSGTNLFGTDYFYQYLRDECVLRSGGNWGSGSGAGVWCANWGGARAHSVGTVGFRLACYPV